MMVWPTIDDRDITMNIKVSNLLTTFEKSHLMMCVVLFDIILLFGLNGYRMRVTFTGSMCRFRKGKLLLSLVTLLEYTKYKIDCGSTSHVDE